MASAKGGVTTRRSSSSRSSKKGQEPEVSPARWAGVALVIAAIVGAVSLAVISPSDAVQPSQPGTEVAEVETVELSPNPEPSPTSVDMPKPVVPPDIVVPKDGKRTGEYEFDVTVAVPEDRTVARKHLELHIFNNGQHDKTFDKHPKPGSNVKVDGVRLAPGDNVLTAVLSSPAGFGPASEPITVVLDEEIPVLEIVAPSNKLETYEDKVTVEVISEIDANVTIRNVANDHDPDVTIGPSGSASEVIRLKRGKNRIVARSVDQAGQDQEYEVIVTRLDGRPRIKLKVPESVKPPAEIRVVAEITGSDKKPMADAEVHFSLTGPTQSTLNENGTTNAKGRVVWEVPIAASSSPAEKLELGVTVISPAGDTKNRSVPIRVK